MPQPPASDPRRALDLPVGLLPGETPGDPADGVALCLSGGGYRAMLFHVGALRRLNELGYLRKLTRISSVSGGSITAAVMGLHWSELDFDAAGVARGFENAVVAPVRGVAGETIDRTSILRGVFLPGDVADKVADAYRDHLFGHKTLQDLPEEPRFIINATNVQTRVLARFSRRHLADYTVGVVSNPTIELAVAVAASTAFPPFLSPLTLKLDPGQMQDAEGTSLHRPPYTTRMILTDGGVYDNLGLETAWKRCRTVLVSDGGGQTAPEAQPATDWIRHSFRILNLMDHQVRSLRKRQVVGSYISGRREGAFWGIRSKIGNFPAPNVLPCPEDKTLAIAEVKTRLKSLSAETQERIMNWGYAVCDAAMRAHVVPGAAAPAGFPHPGAGLG